MQSQGNLADFMIKLNQLNYYTKNHVQIYNCQKWETWYTLQQSSQIIYGTIVAFHGVIKASLN